MIEFIAWFSIITNVMLLGFLMKALSEFDSERDLRVRNQVKHRDALMRQEFALAKERRMNVKLRDIVCNGPDF